MIPFWQLSQQAMPVLDHFLFHEELIRCGLSANLGEPAGFRLLFFFAPESAFFSAKVIVGGVAGGCVQPGLEVSYLVDAGAVKLDEHFLRQVLRGFPMSYQIVQVLYDGRVPSFKDVLKLFGQDRLL